MLSNPSHILDVNVLIALTDQAHVHHKLVLKWFIGSANLDWGWCPFSEAGFLRVTTNPKFGGHSVDVATAVLADLRERPGFQFWPIDVTWPDLVAPIQAKIFGHQQITDAYLLGLAIQKRAVVVTLDKAFKQMAGAQFSSNVLVLE